MSSIKEMAEDMQHYHITVQVKLNKRHGPVIPKDAKIIFICYNSEGLLSAFFWRMG